MDTLADLASIVTAVVATYAYGNYRWVLHRRVRALEIALVKKSQANDDTLTLRQLAAQLTATEDQVIEAASKSKKVRSTVGRLGNEYRFTLSNEPGTTAPNALGASAT